MGKLLTTMTLLLAMALPASAGVQVLNGIMYISGDSDRQLEHQVRLAVQDHDIDYVVMHGPGGNTMSGLVIGFMLRREGVTVTIPTGAMCASACAAAALGADNLVINGVLIFHRPYFSEGQSGDIEFWYDRFEEYLEFMGASERFARAVIEHTRPCLWIQITDQQQLTNWEPYNFVRSC